MRGSICSATSIARPLIAKKQIENRREKLGADAFSHGATARATIRSVTKSAYYALKRMSPIIAPWREWDLRSREQLIAFAEAHQIPIAKDKRGEAPFLGRRQSFARSSEGKVLEDPALEVPDYVYSRTIDPEKAPDKSDHHHRRFRKGRCDRHRRQEAVARDVAGEAQRTRPCQRHRAARSRGNRFVGMKSRGMYETPGGTILARSPSRASNRSRSIRGAAHLKDELMPKYAEFVYNGFGFHRSARCCRRRSITASNM